MARKRLNLPHVEVSYENALVNGRFVKRAVQNEVLDSDKFKNVTCLDFAMDHLQAIGADGQLADVTGSFGDRTFASMDDFVKHVKNVSDSLDAHAQAAQEKNNDGE